MNIQIKSFLAIIPENCANKFGPKMLKFINTKTSKLFIFCWFLNINSMFFNLVIRKFKKESVMTEKRQHLFLLRIYDLKFGFKMFKFIMSLTIKEQILYLYKIQVFLNYLLKVGELFRIVYKLYLLYIHDLYLFKGLTTQLN